MRPLSLLALALLAAPASAQFPEPADPCPLGTAEARLTGVNVEAALFTNGNLFFGNETTDGSGYLVPLGARSPTGRPLSPHYATGLWLGGTVGGELRTASARYTNFRFRPGLTGSDGTPPSPDECAAADRVWVVSREDVEQYLGGGFPTDDLLEWPVHLGAPVLDGDGIEGNYDLEAGDQPALRGDVMAFWTMTDTATPSFREASVGVDVAVEAFAFRNLALGTETFYRFTVTNRNAAPLEDAYLGTFHDVDLGDPGDDYIGTDTTAHLLYVYNANNSDASYGIPPAYGFSVLESPIGLPNGRDDDRDGEVDEPGERLGLTATSHILHGPAVRDPLTSEETYYRLQGLWNDGTPMREEGMGYSTASTAPITPYVFPGDPIAGEPWSAVNDGEGPRTGGDARGLMSTGPFRLEPGASATVTLAAAYAQGEDHLNSVVKLRAKARGLRQLAADGLLEPSRVTSVSQPIPPALTVTRPAPNPFTGATALTFTGVEGARLTVAVYDALGREVRAPLAVETDGAVEVGGGLAPGVYLVRIAGLGFEEAFPIAKVR